MVSSASSDSRAVGRVAILWLCVVLMLGCLAGCSSVGAGRVWSWGFNEFDVLGYEPSSDGPRQDTPKLIPRLTDITRVIPACSEEGSDFYCAAYAIDTQGRLWGWGLQTGLFRAPRPYDDERGHPIVLPTLGPTVILDSIHVVDVAFTNNETLVVDDKGDVWTWGCGQYARDAEITRPCFYPDNARLLSSWPPVQVPGVSGIVDIAVGESSGVLALDTAGRLWNWDKSTPLTDLTTEYSLPPLTSVTITNRPDIRPFAPNDYVCGNSDYFLFSHVAVVGVDGSVWEWTIPPSPSREENRSTSPECIPTTPHRVTGLPNIVSVASPGNLVAVDEDGTVWSENKDGTVSKIPGLSNIIQMGSDTIALDRTGRVYQQFPDQPWQVVEKLTTISSIAALDPPYRDLGPVQPQIWAVQGSPGKGDILTITQDPIGETSGKTDSPTNEVVAASSRDARSQRLVTPSWALLTQSVSTPQNNR